MQRDKKTAEKREYSRPVLRRIELATDEVLASGCKTFSGGPNVNAPAGCGIANSCVASGS